MSGLTMKFVPLFADEELPEGKSKVAIARSIKVCPFFYWILSGLPPVSEIANRCLHTLTHSLSARVGSFAFLPHPPLRHSFSPSLLKTNIFDTGGGNKEGGQDVRI